VAKLTVEEFARQVADALGGRLVALLLYGSAARGTHTPGRSDVNTLLVCDGVDDALFAALEGPVRGWTRDAGHPAPLLLTEQEWRDSADAFPIEYEEMREAHRLLAGRDPWQGVAVRREDMRRQLEYELLAKLVRLRQAYAACWSDPRRLTEAITGSASGVLTMLRTALRLSGVTPPAAPDALVREAAARIGFASGALDDVLAHLSGERRLALAKHDARAAAYLAVVARTTEFVNRLT
jgi:predicted nucleotidyltransferase